MGPVGQASSLPGRRQAGSLPHFPTPGELFSHHGGGSAEEARACFEELIAGKRAKGSVETDKSLSRRPFAAGPVGCPEKDHREEAGGGTPVPVVVPAAPPAVTEIIRRIDLDIGPP